MQRIVLSAMLFVAGSLGFVAGTICGTFSTVEAYETELSQEYRHCYAEGFTSDHTGIRQGYVQAHFYGIGEEPLTVRLHDSRAEELINTLTKARADVARLMEEDQ